MRTENEKSNYKVLIIDDELVVYKTLDRMLSRLGYETSYADNISAVMDLIETTDFDAVLCDIKMPDISGIGILKKIKNKKKYLQVIMLTGYATLNTAAQATEAGAIAFLTKPLRDLKEISLALDLAVKETSLQREASN